MPRTPGHASIGGYGIDITYPDERIWVNQMLEIFMADWYGVRHLPLRPTVIDGGANIGVFSLFVLWQRPAATICAVEPGADNLVYLRRNLQAVPPDRIRIVACALGRDRGVSTLGSGDSDSLRAGQPGPMVETVPLRDLIQGHVDLLKLDVEGSELDALTGAGEALRMVDRVVIEYHVYRGEAPRLADIIRVMQDAGLDRFGVSNHIEFRWDDPRLPVHTCLIRSWWSAAS